MKTALTAFLCLLSFVMTTAAQNTAEMLGYDADARVLIINADDFGMCHSENKATMDLLLANGISSATVMVPCPWFEEAAQFCRDYPEKGVGIHLTLTNEWKRFKWGSTASSNLVPSLLNEQGYFYPDVRSVEQNAVKEEVMIELRAQIEKALQSGIDPTHLDNHMGSVYGLVSGISFLDVIFELCLEYQLPFRLPRQMSERYINEVGKAQAKEYTAMTESWIARGIMLPDHLITVKHGQTYEETLLRYKELLQNLKPGVTELYIHAAVESPEIKAISNAWQRRVFDLQAFLSPEMSRWINDQGIQVISWKPLREAMRK